MPAGLLGKAALDREGRCAPKSFATDIRPLFRDGPDVDSMRGYGLDLSFYEEVKERAAEIYVRFEDGNMPCDEPWPPERLAIFRLWMDEAFPL
jgi:hypothetical protein